MSAQRENKHLVQKYMPQARAFVGACSLMNANSTPCDTDDPCERCCRACRLASTFAEIANVAAWDAVLLAKESVDLVTAKYGDVP